NISAIGADFTDDRLDFLPYFEPIFIGPDGRHLGTGVAGNQSWSPAFSEG
ncbi:MAG: hypothetical protein ACI8S7_001861, partial [Candidatus Krumholzibacteriia bacterium]